MSIVVKEFLKIELPFNEKFVLYSRRFGSGAPEVAITSGFYGDEHNGLYVIYKLIAFLKDILAGRNSGWKLKGSVTILPALNPLGTITDHRFWAFDDRDINAAFPGVAVGETAERIADAVWKEVRGCRYCVDLHSGRHFLSELPQVRVGDNPGTDLALAGSFRLPVVWIHSFSPGESGTLAYNLGQQGVPTFLIHCGSGRHINKVFSVWVFSALLRFLRAVGVLEGSGPETRFDNETRKHLEKTLTVRTPDVHHVVTDQPGIYVSDRWVGDRVIKGETLGRVIDPIDGVEVAKIISPVNGLTITVRNNPIVFCGTMIARVAAG